MPKYERKLPTTGYWIFVCNLDFWNADEWFSFGETELFYRISDHHRDDMKLGQLGVLRVSDDRRSVTARKGRPKLSKGIYGIFEVVGTPKFIVDADKRGYRDPSSVDKRWRVRLRMVHNATSSPLLARDIPVDEDFKYIHRPLQTSSIPLSGGAFRFISNRLGYQPVDSTVVWTDLYSEKLNSVEGIRDLEQRFAYAVPTQKSRVSRYVERGPIGSAVKEMRKGRCQLCELLSRDPVAFLNKKGLAYSEAHHVIPVSKLMAGSLSTANIMVLCPNHHRQAHLGNFEVVKDDETHWSILLDDQLLQVEKPDLGRAVQ